MLSLRFRRFWIVTSWTVVIAAFIVCLVPSSMLAPVSLSDKSEHGLGYTALTLWFCGLYPSHSYRRIALSLVGMGILIEILQGLMNLGRHAELLDVVADSVGIVLGLLLAKAGLRNWAQWLESAVKFCFRGA